LDEVEANVRDAEEQPISDDGVPEPFIQISANHRAQHQWKAKRIVDHTSNEIWLAANFTYLQKIAEEAGKTRCERTFEENLEKGYIVLSKSPMALPVFFIKKKDGKLWLIQDYRKLNDITIKNRYPLPLASDIINRLQGATYFTKFDVRWGYNNVWITEGDKWKAVFATNRSLYKPKVMFFGMTNSPATFQGLMNSIFSNLIAAGTVAVYLDDILIFTNTLEEHWKIVREVLKRLRNHNLYLQPEKCEFEKTEVEYLGLIISKGRVAMDPAKIRAVKEWEQPKNLRNVCAFIGFANFYQRFIKGFAQMARPLHDLTKKDAAWRWTSAEQQAFQSIKDAFI
jgi:hypothetical protein